MKNSPPHGRLLGGVLFVALLLEPDLAIAAGSSPMRQSIVSQTLSGTRPLSAQPQPQGVPVSNDLLYVSTAANNSISIYRHDASGNAKPIAVIAGSRTGLHVPEQLSEDAQGNLYVANGNGTGNPAVLVFAHGASGDVAPIRVLSGPNTNLGIGISTLVVDPVTGKLFVIAYTQSNGPRPYSQVLRFPPNANGNTPPFAASVYTFLARQIANDSTGTNIIDAHAGEDFGYFEGVATFAKQFANGSDLKYGPQIAGLGTGGIADDPVNRTYWVTTGYGIMRLAENASGNGPDGPGPGTNTHITPAPIAVITSATACNLLALGYLRNLYAVCDYNGHAAIEVFAPTANGNATPIRVLNIGGPSIYEGGDHGIFEGK